MKRISSILLSVCCSFIFGLDFARTAVTAQDTNEPAKSPVAATPAPPPSSPAQRSAAELEKLAAPIALHPDPLIAIILPAAVYPVEIVQAARFVKDTNNIPKVEEQSWDENVKAVAKFPDLIAKMDADLAWTIELGKAFLEQPKELMDTIQSLRAKAQKAGTLQNTPQQVVTVTNEVVMQTNVTQVVTVTNQVVQIQPSNPQVVYVPTYPPTVYYPPPSYVYDPYAPLVTFGVGMAMGAIIANNCDWHGGGVWVGGRGVAVWGGGGYHGDVDVNVNRNVNVNQSANVNRNVNRTTSQSGATAQQQKWQPDQNRVHTSGATAQTREARGWGSASSQSAQTAAGAPTGGDARPSQPSAASGGTRPSQQPSAGAGSAAQPSGGSRPSGANRPTTTPSTRPSTPQEPAGSRPTPSASGSRASSGQTANRPSPQSSPAFNGVGAGSSAQNFSSRGAASRGGGARGGGGGRR